MVTTTANMGVDRMPLVGRAVLVVDGEPLAPMDIADCLQDAGAWVLLAADIVAALRLADHPGLSAGVLDYQLASGDSVSVCRRLAERRIPFLFYSDGVQPEAFHAWSNAPVVKKPARDHVLVAAVARLLQ